MTGMILLKEAIKTFSDSFKYGVEKRYVAGLFRCHRKTCQSWNKGTYSIPEGGIDPLIFKGWFLCKC